MKWFLRIVLIVISIECVVAAVLIGKRMMNTQPVLPNLTHVDTVTAKELQSLAKQAVTGSHEEWSNLAHALLGHGYYNHAEQCYRHVSKLSTDKTQIKSEVQFHIAFCLDRTGRIDASTELYRTVAENSEKRLRATCYYAIGKNYLRQEKPTEALQALLSAEGLQSARLLTAKTLLRVGQADKAMRLIDIAREEQPKSMKLLQLAAITLAELNEPEKAHQALEFAERADYLIPINTNTNFVQQYYNRYGIAKEVNKLDHLLLDEKYDEMEKLIAQIQSQISEYHSPTTISMLTSEANVALWKKDPQATLSTIKKMRSLGENRTSVSELEGNAFEQLKQLDKAELAWQRALLLTPSPRLHMHMVELYKIKNNKIKERHHIAGAAFMRGRTLFYQNQLPEGLKELKQSVGTEPTNARAWFYLAETQRHLEQNDAAIKSYQQCLKHNSNHGRAITALQRLNKTVQK